MKNILFASLVALVFAAALCATTVPASSANMAQTALIQGGPTPASLCVAGKLCGSDGLRLRAGEGAPMPICTPGKPCDNGQERQLRLRAGEGAPMPICTPGKPCDNGQERQLRLRAGEGAPMPICTPGKPCDNGQERPI